MRERGQEETLQGKKKEEKKKVETKRARGSWREIGINGEGKSAMKLQKSFELPSEGFGKIVGDIVRDRLRCVKLLRKKKLLQHKWRAVMSN